MNASKSDYSIIRYNPEDIPQILNLLNRVFSKQQHFDLNRDIKWWNWKYDQNVFGKPIIIVVRTDQHKIIGVRALWPWTLTYRGENLQAFQPVDTSVDPEYHRMGLFTQMNEKAIEEARRQETDIIFNFPNKNSLNGYIKMGSKFLGKLDWNVRILKPLNLALSIKQKKQLYPVELPTNHQITHRVCEAIQKNNEPDYNFIDIKKDAEFLKWRYSDHPYFNYGYISEKSNESGTTLIFIINENQRMKEIIVTDIIGSSCNLTQAFKNLEELARSLDVTMITAINSGSFKMKQKLWKLGFIPMKKKNLVAMRLNSEADPKILNIKQWNLFGGLHDSI